MKTDFKEHKVDSIKKYHESLKEFHPMYCCRSSYNREFLDWGN